MPNRTAKLRARHRPPLAGDLFEIIVSAGDLVSWPFRSCLMWAAGRDGILRRDYLQRVAYARGYRDKWVDHVAGKDWLTVWTQSVDWWNRKNDRY
jgi:hypothetical protein